MLPVPTGKEITNMFMFKRMTYVQNKTLPHKAALPSSEGQVAERNQNRKGLAEKLGFTDRVAFNLQGYAHFPSL
jgi:hypothetical protein